MPLAGRPYRRGSIHLDAIYAWKATIVSLSHAFEARTIDDLLFLGNPNMANYLCVSGDGVTKFSGLIGVQFFISLLIVFATSRGSNPTNGFPRVAVFSPI